MTKPVALVIGGALAYAEWGTAAVAVGLTLYGLACWLFPLAACSRCHGTGRIAQPFSGGSAWRTCGGCGGRRERFRLGRRLWHWFSPSD